jgi:recombination protein U
LSPLKIHYPDGQPFHYNKDAKEKKRKQMKTDYGNRGMTLEKDLNLTNKQYLNDNIAVIHKKPTPIQVVNVDYPKRSAAKITEAYYRRSSTTDYNGVYQGYYLDFEAKETKNKKSFPLNNFHEHQIQHMKQAGEHGGICFTIVRFSALDKLFLFDERFLLKWWKQQFQADGRKSIPLKAIQEEGYEIAYGYNPRIPYLNVIDELIKEKMRK